MELVKESPSAELTLEASGMEELLAGQGIRIQIGTPGSPDLLLEEQVPAGKKWNLWIHIRGVEVDT